MAASVQTDALRPVWDEGSAEPSILPMRHHGPMETWQAINTARVVRKFSDEPIADEHLERILDAGRRTGSSKNDQHWAFIVLRDRDHLRELAAVGDYAGHLAGATVAIALVTPNATGHYNNSVMWDCGRAAQNMVLAAWELGIGSVPATVYDHDLASGLLGLPEDRRCDFLLSFGHPADPAKLTARNRAGGRVPLSELVHEERW
jgi:nitroreductase